MAWSTIRRAPSSFETSATTAVACPPAALTSATTDSAAASVTSATTTRAPSAANIWAATRPIPLAPPVMIETLSWSRIEPSFMGWLAAAGSLAAVAGEREHPLSVGAGDEAHAAVTAGQVLRLGRDGGEGDVG